MTQPSTVSLVGGTGASAATPGGPQPAAAPAKKKMTQDQLLKEIDDLNAFLERAIKSLEKFFPKTVIDSLVNPTKEQIEHEKFISFDTQIDCMAEFFSK